MKKPFFIIMLGLLLLSIGGNIYLGLTVLFQSRSQFVVIDTPNANSRETYFSIHNMESIHEISTGKGVKIGILDWGFGYLNHQELYEDGLDFSGNGDNFNHTSEHGYWMANVLREIAPDCEIYALGTFDPDSEGVWVDNLIRAIDWAIESDLDVLTLSHQAISGKNREKLDEAVNRAVDKGIVTTFIHYDNPVNLLPFGLFSGGDGYYSRDPDLNILHYDYNTLFLQQYLEYEENPEKMSSSDLYLSISSTSPVTAGFIAMLKELNPDLNPADYKDILVQSSYSMEFEGETAPHVADIKAALEYMTAHY